LGCSDRDFQLSVCTTNYNCAHALDSHLSSVYDALSGLDFEYVVVDNFSKDDSLRILKSWAAKKSNMTVLARRCTMGSGRQIASERARGSYFVVLDTDVVYSTMLRKFIKAYLHGFSALSVQAIYCGVFPGRQWIQAGGRRSLNTNEDVDLWVRIARFGTMKWFPVALGRNLKEEVAWGMDDHLSNRYSNRERVLRLIRREWDLMKTRGLGKLDLTRLIRENTIDLGIGAPPGQWPQARVGQSDFERAVRFVRDLKQVWSMR